MNQLTHNTHDVELEVRLDPEEMRRRAEAPELRRWSIGVPQTLALRLVDFDTAQNTLASEKIRLRLIHEADSITQQLQLEGDTLSKERVRGPGPDLDAIKGEAAAPMKKIIGTETLIAKRICKVRRTIWRLAPLEGSEVALILDSGTLTDNNLVAPMCEAEIELIKGDSKAAFMVAEALYGQDNLRFHTEERSQTSSQSTSADAYAFASPKTAGPVHDSAAEDVSLAVLAEHPDLIPEHSIEVAFIETLRSVREQIMGNMGILTQVNDAKSARKFRVGLRRLRSTLLAFKHAVASPASDELNDAARELSRIVGELRDMQALAALVYQATKEHPDEPGFASLSISVAEAEAKAYENVKTALANGRGTALANQLDNYLELKAWRLKKKGKAAKAQKKLLGRPVNAFAAKAIAKRYKRVEALGKHLSKNPEWASTQKLHAFRLAIKKLRYSADLFRSLHNHSERKAYLARAKALQTTLGQLNNAALSARLYALAHDIETARAAGYVVGRAESSLKEMRKAALEDWQALRAQKPYWV